MKFLSIFLLACLPLGSCQTQNTAQTTPDKSLELAAKIEAQQMRCSELQNKLASIRSQAAQKEVEREIAQCDSAVVTLKKLYNKSQKSH